MPRPSFPRTILEFQERFADEDADLAIKQKALDRTTPPSVKAGRYQPTDRILAFLDAL